MQSKEIQKFVRGFQKFRERFFSGETTLYDRLSQGQSPKTLIIGCSDSRVDPAILLSANPGELFMIRNVANLVPPYENSNSGFHGVSAAIEFAVTGLKVENIVVLGHSQCGGIRALMTQEPQSRSGFVGQWMKIAEAARRKALETCQSHDIAELCTSCEQHSIQSSLGNLMTFPFVQEAVASGHLSLYGFYFHLESGELRIFDSQVGSFVQLS